MPEYPWVVGSRGLLGRALIRKIPEYHDASPIPWGDPRAAEIALRRTARAYATRDLTTWCIIWAAGAGVVGVSEAAAKAELEQFRLAIRAIREHLPPGRGVFFLSSSAGGVYAGSSGPPFDEETEPCPISQYGHLKLAMERVAIDVLGGFCSVVIGRFANLYGPGQNLQKSQGLISKLCLHTLTRRALNVYVPLETMRDYLYVEDAATLTLATIRRATTSPNERPTVRVLASQEPATVARLIDLITRQSHHRPLISIAVDANASFQVRDLRVRTRYSDEYSSFPRTSLPVGVAKVFRDVSDLLQAGALSLDNTQWSR